MLQLRLAQGIHESVRTLTYKANLPIHILPFQMQSSKPPYSRIEYRDFSEKDLSAITQLLQDNNLPVSDLKESNIDFILATDEGKVVGCIGLEQHST